MPQQSFETIAPARVNLLGEHTDYTGGLVLPMAIPFRTTARLTAGDQQYEFRSSIFPGAHLLDRHGNAPPARDWSDYPVGVLRELQKLGIDPPPFRLELSGDVPFGAGLSSSASVEVATCIALLRWSERALSVKDIALLCQRAENLYVGAPCGIMDQTAITAARAGHALLINTRTLDYEPIPMNTGGFTRARIVILNSEVKHSVAGGEYGLIRRQMELGQTAIRARFPQTADLGMATIDQLQACRADMPADSFKRCHHVITENARVLQAREAMLSGDVARMGRLMADGHVSQRDDLGTSCTEIDFLVDAALGLEGCFGARMTGGGFGGCTVNLVAADQTETFSAEMRKLYAAQFGIDAAVYVCEAVDGAVAANNFAAANGGN